MRITKIICYLLFLVCMTGCNSYHPADKEVEEFPVIFPDYAAVTFPSNIAPPNFVIQEEGEGFQTEMGIVGENTMFTIHSDEPLVTISPKDWTALLEKAVGKEI